MVLFLEHISPFDRRRLSILFLEFRGRVYALTCADSVSSSSNFLSPFAGIQCTLVK